jgi:Family of unknown function (DUF5343)
VTVPAMVTPNAIPRFLELIRKAGVPAKVDGNYLKTVGFKNNNDAALVPLFRSLGFLDASGQPTSMFREYRASSAEEAKQLLGNAIRACYPGLFEIYPDAYRKDDEALTNWLRANTDKGEATQSRALRTFKVLRDAASFEETQSEPIISTPVTPPSSNGITANESIPNRIQYVRPQGAPDVTINITLQIAATDDASIYDKFFASMKKHLFSDET